MTSDQFEAALEYIDDKLDMIIEAMSTLVGKDQFQGLEQRVYTSESDIKILKSVSREHGLTLREYVKRVGRLERQN